ncbi:PLP-dependent transferase [Sphingobacterium daejeonense]|uniref:PLP-dependent transferase n=1 Tax=Sphingobacterium daejeonense TaxID=371142 RepID=UPI0018D9D990
MSTQLACGVHITDKSQKSTSGITTGMLRISVGIEHIDDLIQDFDQALKEIK